MTRKLLLNRKNKTYCKFTWAASTGYGLQDFEIRFRKTSEKAAVEILGSEDRSKGDGSTNRGAVIGKRGDV